MSDRVSGHLTTVVAMVAFALALSVLAACASVGARLAAPKVTVESISVGGIRGTDAMVTLSLRVENPNAIDLMLQSLRFGLGFEYNSVASGRTGRSETL